MTNTGRTSVSVEIAAGAGEVWALVRDFGGVAAWNPIAVRSRIVLGEEGRPGAERVLDTADGATVRERLLSLDEDARSSRYEMVTFPIPVSAQTNRITVSPLSGGTGSRVDFACEFTARGATPEVVADANRAAFANAAQGLAQCLGVACKPIDAGDGESGGPAR